jgi:hypothetical protein
VEASVLSPLHSLLSAHGIQPPLARYTLPLYYCAPSSSSARTTGKRTTNPKAPVLKLPVANVRVTPKPGWHVKRASYTAVNAMKIRRATAIDYNDEGDIDDEDDYSDDDMDDYSEDDMDDYGDDDMDDYGDDDMDDYGDDDKGDYGDDVENNTDDDGDEVTLVAHKSSKGRGQHAATDLRIPRRHSVPHTAPDCLALTTFKQTFDVPHVPTIAELTSGIKARMSAYIDEHTASFETGYKLVIASLATANAMGPHLPRTSVRDGGCKTDRTSHTLPPCVTHTLPPHTNIHR